MNRIVTNLADCRTAPLPVTEVKIGINEQICNETWIAWAKIDSCMPVTDYWIECREGDGIYIDMGIDALGETTQLKVKNSKFLEEPFNFKYGMDIKCRFRSQNIHGWSKWTESSAPFQFSDCQTSIK